MSRSTMPFVPRLLLFAFRVILALWILTGPWNSQS